MSPEKEPFPQKERIHGRGEIYFRPFLDIHTTLALNGGWYHHPTELFKNKKLAPEKLVLRGKDYPINGWQLFEEEKITRTAGGIKKDTSLKAILFSDEIIIGAVRTTGTYPTRSADKKFYKETWYIYGDVTREGFFKMLANGEIAIPGTSYRFPLRI